MRHSEKIDQFAAAFVLAQGNMGDIIKTSVNPHYKSKYAALPDVVEVIVPALQSQGIAVLQSGSTTVETMLIHAPSGQWMAGDFELPPSSDPQKACGANTYARRYALLGMVCAAADDDDGNKAASKDKPAPKFESKQETKSPTGGELMARAVAVGAIPQPDRIMFLEFVRSKVKGCRGMETMTASHAKLVDDHLSLLEEPV